MNDFETLRSLLKEEIGKIPAGARGDVERKQAAMMLAGVGILERFIVAVEMLSIPHPKG